ARSQRASGSRSLAAFKSVSFAWRTRRMSACQSVASPVVRRDRSEARKRTLRFHASTIMEGTAPTRSASPSSVGERRVRRVNTPWASPMMMSWTEEDHLWASPGTPLTRSNSGGLSGTQATTPPMSPEGTRKDSLDNFVNEQAWSRRPVA
ncbi:unnamed protein product, partial [Effrenium voratum]